MNPTNNTSASALLADASTSSLPTVTNQQTNHVSQSQNQAQGGSQFRVHVQGSQPQGQAQGLGQKPRFAQAQTQAQQQAAYVRIQTHLQAQGQMRGPVQNQGTATATAVSSPPVATPVSSGNKRSSHKPSNKPQAASSSNLGSPFKMTEVAPAASRKKRKQPKKQIPDNVASLLPESALYTRLLEFESRVDALLVRKKVDVHESLKNPMHFQKWLRVYVFNTYENQAQMDTEDKGAEAPSWSLRIIGRILEDGTDSKPSHTVHERNTYPKFSSLFKKVTIYLDSTLYPDNPVILWENTRSPALHEGFEVKRKGDKEFTAIIRLEMNYVPEMLKLSSALAQALGFEAETRSRVTTALWHYVKLKKLQDPADPSVFTCDPPLRKIFGEDKIKFATASLMLLRHLSPLQPIHLEHKIKLSGDNPSGNTCCDIQVNIPFPLQKDMSAFMRNLENCKEVDAYDEVISGAITKMKQHCRKRAFFLGLSESPAEFINTLIGSQDRDLKIMAGDALHNAEKEHHAEFFNQPWVEDAILQYLNHKPAAGVDAAKGKLPTPCRSYNSGPFAISSVAYLGL